MVDKKESKCLFKPGENWTLRYFKHTGEYQNRSYWHELRDLVLKLKKEETFKEEKIKKVNEKIDWSKPLTWKVTKKDLIYVTVIVVALFIFLIVIMSLRPS